MNNKKLIIFALLGIFAKGYAVEMDLNDVLGKLNKSNREILIQDMEVESQDLENRKQFKNMLPTVSIDWQNDFVENTTEDQNDFNSSGDSTSNLKISIPLFQGGALYNQYKKSILNKESSLQDRNLVGYGVEERAITAYFNILNKRTQVETSLMVDKALSEQEKRLNSLYKSNKMIPKSELLKVQADLVLNKATLNRNIKEQRSAEEALFLILNMPFDSEIEFKENSLETLNIDMYNLEEDIETAIKYGSKTKKEEFILENAGIDVKLAKAELYPKINASTTYRLDSVPSDENEYQVSLSASWEIFSWGSTIDDVKQKRLNYDQSIKNFQLAIDTIVLEIRDQYRQLEILTDEVYAQKTNLELEKENMRIDKMRYENGIISTYDYLDSINRLSDAQDSYHSLQRDLTFAIRVYENLLR